MTSPPWSAFPFVERLSADGRQQLAALPALEVQAGTRLLAPGDRGVGAYFVTRGSLRVYYIAESGREATLYHVEPGGTCVLALGATVNDAPYPAWVESGPQGGTFVRVPPPLFHRLVDQEPAFRQFVLTAMGGRIFDLMARLEELGSMQLEQRLARYLLRWQDTAGVVRVTQATIAAELGTAREVVSRILRGLEHRGLVATGRARVRICDRPALDQFAQG